MLLNFSVTLVRSKTATPPIINIMKCEADDLSFYKYLMDPMPWIGEARLAKPYKQHSKDVTCAIPAVDPHLQENLPVGQQLASAMTLTLPSGGSASSLGSRYLTFVITIISYTFLLHFTQIKYLPVFQW
jgi:hypothetical protein